jgi:hypothetical protein
MTRNRKVKKDKEGRFICPNCKKSILSISQIFSEFNQLKWNNKTKRYKKQPTDSRGECICDHCKKPINSEICENLSSQEDS